MATIQIKRFEGVDVDLEDKSEILAYGELAVNVDDNRLWVGSNGNGNLEITQQIIFQEYRPEDVANYPQPPIYRDGQLWWDTNTGTGQKLYISHKGTAGGDQPEWRDVSGGGGFTVARYLNDLWDVQTQNTAVGDVLAWNGSVWDSTSVTVENLPNVDADWTEGMGPRHGDQLTYDDWTNKWVPSTQSYDGGLLVPHTHYSFTGYSTRTPQFFPSRPPSGATEVGRYGDTVFVIVKMYTSGAESIDNLVLTQASIDDGWKHVMTTPYPYVSWYGGLSFYDVVYKKFLGTGESYSETVELNFTRTFSVKSYGFQVRGNANIEFVKTETVAGNLDTQDPIPYTLANDANILTAETTVSFGVGSDDSGLNIIGDDFTAYETNDTGNHNYNSGFVTKKPYTLERDTTVSIEMFQSGANWRGVDDIVCHQYRVTSGIDESKLDVISDNPDFDFLDGASDQNVLVYNGGTSKWEAVNKPPLSNNALEEIGDVDVTGVADGDVLAWDSANTDWKPYSIPVLPDRFIEKQYNFSGPIEANSGILRYYLPADISEIRITPYLIAPSTDGRVGAYLNYNGISIAFAVLQAGETVGAETVVTGLYAKGKYLTVEITDAGTDAQTLSLLITLKRA